MSYSVRYTPEAMRDMDAIWDGVNYKKYKAFYRVRDGYLEVIRIILMKSDYIKMLFGEQEESFDDF